MNVLFFTILISSITSCGTHIQHRMSSTSSSVEEDKIESSSATQKGKPLKDLEKLENIENISSLNFEQQIVKPNVSDFFNLSDILLSCLFGMEPANQCEDSNILLDNDISIKEFSENMCNSVQPEIPFLPNFTRKEPHLIQVESSSLIHVIDICTLVLFTIGFVASSITSLVIIKLPRLHKPFYVSVFFLSLSDLFCIITFLVRTALGRMMDFCQFNAIYNLLEIIRYSTKLNASLNVLILSTVRYMLFVYPIRSKLFLTNRKMILSAVLSFALSLGYGIFIINFIWVSKFKNLKIIYVADDVILLFFFVLVNISFFINRIRAANVSRVARHLKTRMTLIVFCILSMNAVNALFEILTALQSFQIGGHENINDLKVPDSPIHVFLISKIVYAIVHLVNPFIYFFSSPLVYKKCFSKT